MVRFTTALLTVLLVLGFSMAASAADIDPTVPSVALGTDYFVTLPGTHFNFGGPIGDVLFLGLPIGPFNTDTIVQRKADAVLGGPAIPIQMIALSLKSIAPVNVGGSFFDVFVTLDPTNLPNDTGIMSIAGTTSGGTFTSSIDVYFDAYFSPVSSGAPFDVFSSATLVNAGSLWSPTPPAGAGLVNGPDDGSALDQQANTHSGLVCTSPTGICEVDFFLTGQPLIETHPGGNGMHIVNNASAIPEPGTMLLLGSALLALGFKLKLRRA